MHNEGIHNVATIFLSDKILHHDVLEKKIVVSSSLRHDPPAPELDMFEGCSTIGTRVLTFRPLKNAVLAEHMCASG